MGSTIQLGNKVFNLGLKVANFERQANFIYLINEDFEGSGTPAGWFRGGSADFDSTAVVLAGSQSLSIDKTTSDYATYIGLSSDKSEVWGKMLFRRNASLPSAYSNFFGMSDAGFSYIFRVGLLSTGVLVLDSGTIYLTTSDSISVDTVIYIWFHFKKGTGSDAIAEIWWNTVNTRPITGGSKYAGATNGNISSNVNSLLLYNETSDSSGINIFDNFQIAETEFV